MRNGQSIRDRTNLRARIYNNNNNNNNNNNKNNKRARIYTTLPIPIV